jgi:thiol-disulfide isomerase/thioredoxin
MVRFAAAAFALAATLHGIAACGAEIVLLDFWSPTCGPCMQMKPTVESLVNARYPIRQVDTSREQEMAQQYNVTGIPCFVMLVDGQEVDRVVGATSSERLQKMFTRAKEIVASRRPQILNQSPELPPRGEAANAISNRDVSTTDRDDPVRPGVADIHIPRDADWPRQFDSNLVSSSVRLTLEDAKGRSHGTGTVIDAREGEALVITCGHLFRETKGESPVSVELFESGPQGVRVVETVTGKVISYDLERDVAFVSIRPTHPVCVAQVAPQRTHVARGDRAASVGCSNGQDPTVMATRVTWLDRYQGPPNIEASGAPVVGRSGGGLFNDKGQLVGVCFAADYEGNKGLYAGLDSIHDELKRLGLQEIYAKPETGLLADNSTNAFGPLAAGPIVRGQEMPAAPAQSLDGPANPPIAGSNIGPQDSSAAESQPLNNPIEQATLEEVVSRAATKKVVCIIRSDEPGVEDEIITIENVSKEFVEALAVRRQKEAAVATHAPAVDASDDGSRYNR